LPSAPLKLVVSHPRRGLAFQGDDAALVAAALAGDETARRAMYERHASHVFRVLRRVLGFSHDLDDLVHEVFVRAIVALPQLTEPALLKGWLTKIAVRVAHDVIARKKRRWLWFLPDDELAVAPANTASGEVLDAVHATYAVLESMPFDERVAFALRFIDELELEEVAAACETSLATIKRRLGRASTRFENGARRPPARAPRLEGGTRWPKRTPG
jgi:RNA polymerase sigma-70 factor, ECF subfamily